MWSSALSTMFAMRISSRPAIPNVYSVNWTKTFADGYRLYQTFFDPILVDDPNATIFTMRQEDGPLVMVSVKDYATLTKVEGTWLYDSGKIYVHPYSNRVPRTTTTDLVIGHRLNGNLYRRQSGSIQRD